METIEKWVSGKLAPVKEELKRSFLFTFLWGLAAHGYMFFNNSISHDSIDEFVSVTDIAVKKIGSGRFFVPVLHFLRGPISAPWWLGMLSLACIALAVFFIIRMFDIREKWMICLVAGFMTANMTYTALAATYIHDIDCNCLALLLAVLAAYLWRTQEKGALYGILPLALSMGIYQSFLSVAITLVVIASILELVHGKNFKAVFFPGLRAVGMVIGGGIAYYVLLKLVTILVSAPLSTGTYNSLDNILNLTPIGIVKLFITTWLCTAYEIITVNSMYPGWISAGIQGVVILICVGIVVAQLLKKQMGAAEKLLLIALCGFLPVGMNVSRVLSDGMSHDLMYYAFWLVYLLVLLLTRELAGDMQKKGMQACQVLAAALIAVTLVSNVQGANAAYTAKRFIQDANLSLFTRIVSDVEDQKGYVPGQTPISILGGPDSSLKALPEQYEKYYTTGFEESYVIGSRSQIHYQCYFDYVLMNPGVIATKEQSEAMWEHPQVQAMPVYPCPGSVAMVDGIAVVKLSD